MAVYVDGVKVAGRGGSTVATNTSSFTISLSKSGWSGGLQTVHNNLFLASGYGYITSPSFENYEVYADSVVRAKDVTTDGEITFCCSDVPSSDLIVNVLRVPVET